MSDDLLQQLEAKLDDLLQRYQRLQIDSDRLRAQEHQWQSERARLLEKQEIARTRIESLIARLKQLENTSK